MRRLEDVDVAQHALRGRDLVVFSNDWDGDPLSKTHIMRILSRENRVLWVNSLGNRAPKANAHDLKRIWTKLQSFQGGIREVEPNIFVLSPLAIPLYGSEAVRALNGELLKRQVRQAMKTLGFTRPITWSFFPASAPVVGTIGEELVVYQCVDEFSAFSDTNGKHIAEMESQLLAKANLVICSAERLYQSKSKQNANTRLVRHGVDFHHFVKACDPKTEVPADVRHLPKPVIGFFGLIADWVDLEAIAAAAKAHPQGSVVMLGKVQPGVDVGVLKALPNVHFLGRKKYEDLPAYCKGFDVALMPFRLNELTLNANPLKVREYLAAGLPVVSTDIPEVRSVGQCLIATSHEDFVDKVKQALADAPGPRRERAQRIFHESWDARVDDMRRAVGETLLKLNRSF